MIIILSHNFIIIDANGTVIDVVGPAGDSLLTFIGEDVGNATLLVTASGEANLRVYTQGIGQAIGKL